MAQNKDSGIVCQGANWLFWQPFLRNFSKQSPNIAAKLCGAYIRQIFTDDQSIIGLSCRLYGELVTVYKYRLAGICDIMGRGHQFVF